MFVSNTANVFFLVLSVSVLSIIVKLSAQTLFIKIILTVIRKLQVYDFCKNKRKNFVL